MTLCEPVDHSPHPLSGSTSQTLVHFRFALLHACNKTQNINIIGLKYVFLLTREREIESESEKEREREHAFALVSFVCAQLSVKSMRCCAFETEVAEVRK